MILPTDADRRAHELMRYAAARHGRTDTFHAPVTLDALAALRERLPTAQLLAGSTDVGLWVNKQFRDLGDIVYVGGVEEMKRIGERGAGEDAELYIGAGASLEDAFMTLTAGEVEYHSGANQHAIQDGAAA